MKNSFFTAGLAALMLIAAGCGQQSPSSDTGSAPDSPPAAMDDSGSSATGDADAGELQTETTAGLFPTAPLINPNIASAEELAAIPGLTATAQDAILASRPFATPSELHAALADRLDEDALKSVYRVMFVKVGLNSGANEDYRLIPSTMSARRLAHEFEEYRPYESLDQFRREMAKYVSDEEVAFLARYVTLD